MKTSEVIRTLKPNPLAAYRLFCFPFAGGAASAYKDWSELCHPDMEVCAIQMPGRESRMREPLLTKVEDLVEDIYTGMKNYLDKPYCFFGHSLGALVGFELTLKLEQLGYRGPQVLFVSGCGAPHIPPKEFIHHLPEDEFKVKVMKLGGTPQIIIENPDIFDLYQPILRGDFTMVEDYRCEQIKKTKSKIVAYGGRGDKEVTLEELVSWSNYTQGDFAYKVYEGDHFFIREELEAVIEDMRLHIKGQ